MRMSWEGERRGKGGRRRVRKFFLRVGENCVSLKKRIFSSGSNCVSLKKRIFFPAARKPDRPKIGKFSAKNSL